MMPFLVILFLMCSSILCVRIAREFMDAVHDDEDWEN